MEEQIRQKYEFLLSAQEEQSDPETEKWAETEAEENKFSIGHHLHRARLWKLSVFETAGFEKAFLTPWEAIVIFQIANAYGDMGEDGKAVEILEKTYRNLLRYPDKFYYGERIYANYMRAIMKWKGEMGKIEEAFEMGEHEIRKVFETGYAELLSGLLYAGSYNTNERLKGKKITEEERSEINSGYEIAALISEMFQEEGIADFIRRRIETP